MVEGIGFMESGLILFRSLGCRGPSTLDPKPRMSSDVRTDVGSPSSTLVSQWLKAGALQRSFKKLEGLYRRPLNPPEV